MVKSLLLTEPSLLVALHLNSKSEVCQFDGCAFHLTSQQQVLRLPNTTHTTATLLPLLNQSVHGRRWA